MHTLTLNLQSTPRVNGSMLESLTGKSVLLMGEVMNLGNNIATLTTSDGVQVTVNLPPGDPPSSKYVQVLGRVAGAGMVISRHSPSLPACKHSFSTCASSFVSFEKTRIILIHESLLVFPSFNHLHTLVF
jgi:hypothetical protein